MHAPLDRYIESSPQIRGDRPRIAGTRITVDDVVIMHLRMGQPLAEIAATYDLSLSSLYAAIAYYFDHKSDIDRQIEENDAYLEAARQNSPSKLQAKLKALKGE